jgi:PAS domain S-box-containing protein
VEVDENADHALGFPHQAAQHAESPATAPRPPSHGVETPAVRAETAGVDSLHAQLVKQIVEDAAIVLTIDLHGKIIYANKSLLDAVSHALDDLLGKSLVGMVREGDRESLSEELARAAAGTNLRGVRLHLRDRWGEAVELLVSIRLLSDERGDAIAISAVGIDVTLARKAEERAAVQEDLVAEIERGAHVLLAPFDAAGNTTGWSASCESATGIKNAAALARPIGDLCAAEAPDSVREAVRSQVQALLRGETPHVCCETSPASGAQDEETRCIAWWLAPMRNVDGVIAGGIAIGRDTTPLQLAEQERRAAREEMAALVDADGDAVFVTDRRGAVRYWNDAMERLTQLTAAEIVGGHPEHRLPWLAQSAYTTALGDLLEGALANYESPPRPIETPAGWRSVTVCATSISSRDGSVHGVVVRVQDVTEILHTRSDLGLASACHQRVLELAADHIYTLDAAGRITDINPAARAFADPSGAVTALGFRFEEIVAPASRAAVLVALERAQGGTIVPFTYSLVAQPHVTLSASACAIVDASGHPQRYVIVSRTLPES